MLYQFTRPVTVQGVAHADGEVIDVANIPAGSIECLLRTGYIVAYTPTPAPVPQPVTVEEIPTPAATPPPVVAVQPAESIVTPPNTKPEASNTKPGKRRKEK